MLRREREPAFVFGRKNPLALTGNAFKRPADDAVIEVIAPQGGVAARGEHFKNTLGEFQQRHVKGAAPEVIDEIKAFRGVIGVSPAEYRSGADTDSCAPA